MLVKPLSELKPKERGKIVRVAGGSGIHQRLLDMGLVSGSEVEVERVAPLGDPMQVRIKGYYLTLRKEEAASIQVEVQPLMPLAMVSPGELVTVVDVRAGRGLARRLAEMGLLPGTQIRVVNSQMPGPLIIDLKGSKLALGRGVARKIMVTGV
jgi:Fe2+ transport system protein FeoA